MSALLELGRTLALCVAPFAAAYAWATWDDHRGRNAARRIHPGNRTAR